MWSTSTWAAFCALIDEAWPGSFDQHAEASYRTALDAYDPALVVRALQVLITSGQKFRPSVPELVAAIRSDPTRPTFEEALTLIFSPGGVLHARPDRRALAMYASERERFAICNQAMLDRAAQFHPLIGSFVARYGLERLRMLPVDDPQWGNKHRADLERAWERHVAATDGREALALASGRKGELRALDPLAAIGQRQAQITEGEH
jgi:hypothetical protein